MLLVKKCHFFHYFVWLKIRLEITCNNVVDRRETCFEYKNKIFHSPKNGIFPKRFTHATGQKMPIFSYFFFAKKRLDMRFNSVLDRKETLH